MSGFVCVVATDGQSVDPALLAQLTDTLAYFAPDGTATQCMGRVGLGFAHARLTPQPAGEQPHLVVMPATDDRGTWVVADASIDERERLVRELAHEGVRADADACVASLLLAAYRAWGTRCAEHIHGDFSFAIWDESCGRLLLGRDRFGMRPLYYAHAGSRWVFSNALDVVRAHPGVSSALDEAAVADFLRMGSNTDLTTSVFVDIRCVPPAHVLVLEDGNIHVSRYWNLPTGSALSYRRVEDYAEHFSAVFRDAVADRMRGHNDTVLFLSGGRDSTAVAATARGVVDQRTTHLKAVTAVFDFALPDEERDYAGVTASALGIPVQFVAQDAFGWFEAWDRPDLWRPEPVEATMLAAEADLVTRACALGRVALTGEGGDAVLRERESHLGRLLLSGRWARAAAESFTYIRLHHRIPRPGFRRMRMRRSGMASAHPPLPPWLRAEFVAKHRLVDRWAAVVEAESHFPVPDMCRPEAYNKLRSFFWTRCFEADHASATGVPLTQRHPFFDERVVEFLLSLPAVQWANDKGILVAAMRNRLPDRVRLRQKTPLVGDSYDIAFDAAGRPRPRADEFGAEALEYIDPSALFEKTEAMDDDDVWDWTRAYSLALWLRRRDEGRGRQPASAESR